MSIYVASHKPCPVPASPLYRLLALGGADIPGKAVSDDAGDNISSKNKYYCELTGTYWLWKNCTDPVVGLCHYRRYFNLIPIKTHESPFIGATYAPPITDILENQAQSLILQGLLGRYDIIVARPMYYNETVGEAYRTDHGSVEWDAFIRQLNRFYGDGRHLMDCENRLHIGNMLIAKKEIFDLYAGELFGVIDAVFDEVGALEAVENARYQPFRYPGYLAERFTSAFIRAHRLNAYEAQVVLIQGL
jgi:hypothetical protein